MKHQVLARKWRPRIFEEVMGQQHVLQALINSLDMGRLHHAYLFSGTRGVGKTTIARILAKSLNCELGVTSKPCGQCASCIEIEQGRFVDLLEIDAASRTRVEDTRELLDNVQYLPTRGRFKVYLIDEVHMLSRHSFNALLKTLEEPPSHVKFLLATTDPQKLPVTILSRCLQFNLKPLQDSELEAQLRLVLTHESITYEEEALTLLAQSAQGSVRDALSLTEQALAYGHGNITVQDICTMLGAVDADKVIELLSFIVNSEANSVMLWVEKASSWGADYTGLIKQLLALLHSIARSQLLAEPLSLKAAALANRLDPQQVQLYYQILSMAYKDLPYAADQQSGFEMALLRMLSFSPVPAVAKPVPIKTKQAIRVAPADEMSFDEHAMESGSTAALLEPEIDPLYQQAQQELTQVIAQADLQSNRSQFESMALPEPDDLSVTIPIPVLETPSETTELQGLLASHHQLRSHRLNMHGQKADPSFTATLRSGVELDAGVATKENLEKKTEPAPEFINREPVHVLEPNCNNNTLLAPSTIAEAPVNILALNNESSPSIFDDAQQWQVVIDELNLDPILRQLLLNSSLSRSGESVNVIVKPALQKLLEPSVIFELSQRLQSVFSCQVHVYSSADAVGETPMEWQRRRHLEKLHFAEQQLLQDPNVQWLQTQYGASLDQDTVDYI